jgi:hypothetical protein
MEEDNMTASVSPVFTTTDLERAYTGQLRINAELQRKRDVIEWTLAILSNAMDKIRGDKQGSQAYAEQFEPGHLNYIRPGEYFLNFESEFLNRHRFRLTIQQHLGNTERTLSVQELPVALVETLYAHLAPMVEALDQGDWKGVKAAMQFYIDASNG